MSEDHPTNQGHDQKVHSKGEEVRSDGTTQSTTESLVRAAATVGGTHNPPTESPASTPGGIPYSWNGEAWSYIDRYGISWVWDEHQQAWLPQMDIADMEELQRKQEEELKSKRKRERKNEKKEPPPITSVYVTGLPEDTTNEEVATYFSKTGLIKKNAETGEPMVKVYKTEDGKAKGDALITYFKHESVPLAIQILDQSLFRTNPNVTITVAEAVFQGKGDSSQKKPKKKIS